MTSLLPVHLELCPDSSQEMVERDFDTMEEAIAWLQDEHPKLMQPGVFRSENNDGTSIQYGMNYYWAVLSK